MLSTRLCERQVSRKHTLHTSDPYFVNVSVCRVGRPWVQTIIYKQEVCILCCIHGYVYPFVLAPFWLKPKACYLGARLISKTHPPSTIQLATSWGCWWLAFAISGAGDEKWEGAFLPRRHWLAFANGMSLRAALQGARTLVGSPLGRRYGSVYL